MDRSETAKSLTVHSSMPCGSASLVVREYAWQRKGVSGVATVGDESQLQCARNRSTVTCLNGRGELEVQWTHVQGRRARYCGQVGADYPDTEGGALVLIRAIGTGCREARSAARRCVGASFVSGWLSGIYREDDNRTPVGRFDPQDRNVFLPADSYMLKGSKRIDMRGIGGGAPHCIL